MVALNRAIAIGELHGPTAGLDALARLDVETLSDYQPYHAALADLLARADRPDDALRRVRPSHRAHHEPGGAALPPDPARVADRQLISGPSYSQRQTTL